MQKTLRTYKARIAGEGLEYKKSYAQLWIPTLLATVGMEYIGPFDTPTQASKWLKQKGLHYRIGYGWSNPGEHPPLWCVIRKGRELAAEERSGAPALKFKFPPVIDPNHLYKSRYFEALDSL